nr:MAG TPA: hypothetical protein [Caudoviricetes sp.]
MTIDAPNNIKTINEIFPGEVFVSEEDFFLKTETVIDSDGDEIINAVQLINGEPCYFENEGTFFVYTRCTLKVN